MPRKTEAARAKAVASMESRLRTNRPVSWWMIRPKSSPSKPSRPKRRISRKIRRRVRSGSSVSQPTVTKPKSSSQAWEQ